MIERAQPPEANHPASETSQAKTLRQALRPYTVRSNVKALAIFSVFYGNLLALVALALYVDNIWLRMLCAVSAGGSISALFVIGHDAAHSCYSSNKSLDALLGRLALLPALHNFTLWRIVHNRMHHFELCVQGLNSWSPLSKDEFDRLPAWRRAVEKLYRSPLGLGPYYFVERWLKDKFIPTARMRDTRPLQQWLDFFGILTFLGVLGVIFWFAAQSLEHLSYGEAWLWGFVVPFLVWNYLMGFTVYVQHTHPLVPWFRTKQDEDQAGVGQHQLSVQLVFPKGFGLISNNIMEHPAHHVNTKIPLYNLAKAQRHLNELIGPAAVIERFTLPTFLRIMKHCKLFDYDNRRWLGFDGSPSVYPDPAAGYGDTARTA